MAITLDIPDLGWEQLMQGNAEQQSLESKLENFILRWVGIS
jgi:hypothetical protein